MQNVEWTGADQASMSNGWLCAHPFRGTELLLKVRSRVSSNPIKDTFSLFLQEATG